MITCPACAADVDVDEEDLDEGDLFDCTECGVNLRVASLKPLELVVVKDDAAVADDEEDDFDDDEDDDEDDEEEEKEDDYEDELEEEEDEEDDWN
jgi:alpha-aminoadipate carrier protein LysW